MADFVVTGLQKLVPEKKNVVATLICIDGTVSSIEPLR
jgi:hypothetical protein